MKKNFNYKPSRKAANRSSQPIYAGSHVVGAVKNGCFYKSIAKNHYLIKPPAIAFSLDSLAQAERAGASRVQVTDRDTGTIYQATIQHIRDKGFPVHRAGFEPQIALSLDGGWIVQTKPGQRQPVQGSLFGSVSS